MNESTKIIELLESINGYLGIFNLVLFCALLSFFLFSLVDLIFNIRKRNQKKRLAKISKENLNESICENKDNVND